MSAQELFHSLRSELDFVPGRAELLVTRVTDHALLRNGRQLKAAALNVRQHLQQAQQNHL